ncbi:MAG TPA: LLM class flavin-dependent oxidoreductase [Acidimicrobiales bacterium]|nr:LLM class flavin-dependent oxidoreductase [Acidimicrobiales bacterium]
MLVGTTLPQFSTDVEGAVATAVRAEALGLDGVFVFNHLWPIGQPHRPAIECFTLLAAIGQETRRVRIGPLVARIGLLPDAVLVHTIASLRRQIGDRLIAGVGAGDRLSAEENVAYGIEYPPAAERLAAVETVVRALRADGIETWVGGRSPAIRRVAAAAADALNVWDATPAEVTAEGAGVPRITWGGQVDLSALDVDGLTASLRGLEAAGADFAVCAPINAPWDRALEMVAGARDCLN